MTFDMNSPQGTTEISWLSTWSDRLQFNKWLVQCPQLCLEACAHATEAPLEVLQKFQADTDCAKAWFYLQLMLWQRWNQQTCCRCCFSNHQRIFAVIVLYSPLCNIQCTAMTYLPLQHSFHCCINITINIPCLIEHFGELGPGRYICTVHSHLTI